MFRIAFWLALSSSALAVHGREIWRLDTLAGRRDAAVIGHPSIRIERGGGSVVFDGAHDGFVVGTIPIAGARGFTIEAMIAPANGGLRAERFLHVQDERGRRALMEIRIDGRGGWWLDTFLRDGTGPRDSRRTLVNPKRVHPTGHWYWVALRYEGTQMSDFVNGVMESRGSVGFSPFEEGRVSIGVRQNLVYWFKGAIREIRFTRDALPASALQRVVP